jgi:hypothetical protein
MEKINQFLFFKPYLQKISEVNFFRNVFVWFLRVVAGFEVLALLGISYKMWSLLSMGFEAKLFFVLFLIQLLLIFLTYLVVTILLSRADDIAALPLKNDYIVIPIFVIVTKMSGEIFAVMYTVLGVAAAIAIWIIGNVPMDLPGMSIFAGNSGFIGGIIALITGPVLGFIILSISYFVAEQLGVLVDIARNTKK